MTDKKLSPEQEEAVYFPRAGRSKPVESQQSHLVIEAGAGAGKTTLLTERVAWRLLGSDKQFRIAPQDMILVTFSRAAEEELSTRIAKRLQQEPIAEEQLDKLLGRLHISTIDSLFAQLSNNLFPIWWEHQRLRLSEDALTRWGLSEQRFPPPVTLVSEDELRPELSERILAYAQSGALEPHLEIPLLDFILAGAFESQGFQGSTPSRYAGLRRITAAMLHENMLRSDAPPIRFALETIHPMAEEALNAIRTLAQSEFHRRLMHGRMTHNDRMLLLYHLLVAGPNQSNSSFFWDSERQPLPLQCKELIVDEYQDTNELQHRILSALLEPKTGRMIVVGDPKQSIYGFRSAHVGVFQSLKQNKSWKNIELTKNFRSHPDLLPWINYLSELTFSYRNNKIPDEFLRTEFSHSAQKTYVGSKALDVGRADGARSETSQTTAHPRLMLLGASLAKERSNGSLPQTLPSLHTYTTWAIARELKALVDAKHYEWNEMVILCETNDWTLKTQTELQALGIPSIAKTSRSSGTDSQFRARCENVGMILAKWLAEPIEVFEFAQLIWSGWFHTPQVEASELIRAASSGCLGADFIKTSSPHSTEHSLAPPADWSSIQNHLQQSRALAAIHYFSGWQNLRWGFDEALTPERKGMNIEMETFAIAFQNVLEAWTVRKQLEESADRLSQSQRQSESTDSAHLPAAHSLWPSELIHSTLNQVRIQSSASDSTQEALTVCTIHGAKGLEWPVVVFWPTSKRDLPAENFVMKSGFDSTQIKWLAEDNQSASLLPWIANPHPPTDTVAVLTEGQRGESAQLWSTDLQDKLEQDFERQRVFYTAYTRAREMLILVSPGVSGRAQKSLRDKLAALKVGDDFTPTQLKLTGLESNVMAAFADRFFSLRKEAKRGSVPQAPWSGLSHEAQVTEPQYSQILALKDYGPDWLSKWQIDKSIESTGSLPKPTLQLTPTWQQKWADERKAQRLSSPWLRQRKDHESSINSVNKTFLRTQTDQTPLIAAQSSSDSSTQASLSPSELGLRFHALMEHGQENNRHTSSFVNRLLNASLLREHELELWGDFDVEQSSHYASKELVRTQRKILDVFCVVPVERWPKAIMNVDSVSAGLTSTKPLEHILKSAAAADGWIHVIVDFKTGAPKEEHVAQMGQYLHWVNSILSSHPEMLVGTLTANALFASQAKPLVGILCYSGHLGHSLPDKFERCLTTVDKNTSLLFVSTE
jgi:ATP-dependent exoDNAse (exonuclease V) beta subunit